MRNGHGPGWLKRCFLVALAVSVAGVASAKEKVGDQLERLEVQVDKITGDVEQLERQVAPGRGFITERDSESKDGKSNEDRIQLDVVFSFP